MLDVASTSLTDYEKDVLCSPHVGGLILFTRNYDSREQLAALIAEVRSCRPEILIAVDQEGGRVQRFREGFQPLPSLQKIAQYAAKQSDDEAEILRCFGWLMASEILDMGIDFSFAPVLDLDDKQSSVISDRSLSPDPDVCIRLARYYIEGMHIAGMSATAKHFPGHGSVRADSHFELPVDKREMAELETSDLRPFQALAQLYDAVMPGHLLFPNIDYQPVGFSSFWLQNTLRQSIGFEGAIMSDDLSMQGASMSGSYPRRAELALRAGCDMLLVCNNPEGANAILKWLDMAALPDTGDRQARLSAMRPKHRSDENSIQNSEISERAHYHMARILNNA